MVTAGYFRARHKFFARQFRQTDIEYVARQIGASADEVCLEDYSRETYARHQRLILECFGYTPFDQSAKVAITDEIEALVRVQFRPKLILLDTIQIMIRKKIAIPSYNMLADLIVEAINNHQHRLNKIIEESLDKNQHAKLNELLKKESCSGTDAGWRYQLTLLKRPYQSTQPSKIKANLADLDTLQTLYIDLKTVVQRLNLSQGFEAQWNENVR